MKIHEYQAKRLFSHYGVLVPEGDVAFTADEAVDIAKKIMENTGKNSVVLKVQVHAGGRGKAGGVKVVQGLDKVKDEAEQMLGSMITTGQTAGEEHEITRILVEEAIDIERELYVGFLIDRDKKEICVMSSTKGGTDIETVSQESPSSIKKEWFEPLAGLLQFKARNITSTLGLHGTPLHKSVATLRALADLFVREDCLLVEVNPLVLTRQGEVIALDAKINFDDNAAFRHKIHSKLIDINEENPVEIKARELGFTYVGMDGNIGCCVNGAGLAMATMDIIKHEGGDPANFLDVGGGADSETVKNAFEIILTDKKVKSIFVNIFGGILRCDIVAKGVVDAVKSSGIRVPLIVRLEGTKAAEGKEILENSGLDIYAAQCMAHGAALAVEKAKEMEAGAK
ncbi:MAG: ADP-forming succinate--CoA ligase subunit beta [Deltaproteobacteria bacterium]|nr:ADP-forming succinate--CoA ligase subunit beta [Deltaproteobacteria bacterium]